MSNSTIFQPLKTKHHKTLRWKPATRLFQVDGPQICAVDILRVHNLKTDSRAVSFSWRWQKRRGSYATLSRLPFYFENAMEFRKKMQTVGINKYWTFIALSGVYTSCLCVKLFYKYLWLSSEWVALRRSVERVCARRSLLFTSSVAPVSLWCIIM